MSEEGVDPVEIRRGEQGFVLSDGRFVTRKQAAHIAIKYGQIEKPKHPVHGLFSEDLW